MKTIFYFTVAIFLIALSAKAQSDAISTYFSNYLEDENITQISMSGKAFEMAGDFSSDSEDGDTFRRITSQINGLKMVVLHDVQNSRETAIDARKKVLNHFEDLVTVTDKDGYINLMVNENNGLVSEVFAVISTPTDFILASLTGSMKLQDVASLSSEITTLGKGDSEESKGIPIKLRIYPNPVAKGSSLTLSVADPSERANVRIFNASGKEVDNFIMKGREMNYDTSKIGKGSFVLKLTSEDLLHTEKFIVL